MSLEPQVGPAISAPKNESGESIAVGTSIGRKSSGGLIEPYIPDSVEVRLVRTVDTLAQAVEVRRRSYGRHTPEMATVLEHPERLDFSPEAVVFVARSPSSGRVLGSMRVMTNLDGPLEFENELVLPAHFHGLPISLVQRLSLVSGSAALEAKKALFKAYYLYSLAMQIEWMFLYTPPPRDRLFGRLGFAPVLDNDELVSGAFSDNRQVRLLALRVWDVEPLWRESNPEWHDYFFRQYTPGIKIFSSVANWTKSFRSLADDRRSRDVAA